MTSSSAKPWVVVAGVGMLLAGVGGVVAAVRGGTEAPAPATASDAGPRGMTEEERRAYVAASVSVKDLAVRAAQKPGSQDPVPGMLEVGGVVVNAGDRAVDGITLSVYPKGATGEVLGAYQEQLARRPLAPGESRPFRFLVPEKKDFSGQFDHELR